MKRNERMDHMGIVTKLSSKYWRMLPPHVLSFMSLEDMIHEVMLHVLQQKSRYSEKRGAQSTFVWRVADNYCKTILHKYSLKKRAAVAVLSAEDLLYLSTPDYERRFLESRKAVERLLEAASPDLSEAFEQFLLERRYRRWDEDLLREARSLAYKHNITYGDFARVLKRV